MKIILAFIFIALSLTSHADSLQGKVVRVIDGDTISVEVGDNEIYKIRLSGIDAPEKTQAFGIESRQALANEIQGQIVSVEYNKRDKYQRIVGKVTLDGNDINLHQIQRGLAWHYKQYEREQEVEDRSIYANAEYLAQLYKLGLWADPNPIPPWQFRKLY